MTEVTAAFKTNEKVTSKFFYAHTYDIDIVKVWQGFQHRFSHQLNLIPNISTVALVEEVTIKIQEYCQRHDINLVYHINTGNLVIAADDADYAYFMALQLSIIDFNSISAFLDHHYEQYSDTLVPFCNLLQFRVYDLLKNKSPFADVKLRLSFVSSWINDRNALIKNSSSEASSRKRMSLPIPIDTIREYMMRLTRPNKTGEIRLSAEEVEYFLNANFEGFPFQKRMHKLEPKCSQKELKLFIANLYWNVCRKQIIRIEFAHLLKDNFLQFAKMQAERIDKKLTDDLDEFETNLYPL